MNEFTNGFKLSIAANFFFEEILYGLYIVVRSAFDLFYPGRIDFIKIRNNLVKQAIGCAGQRGHFLNGFVRGQGLQPTHFNLYPVMD